MNKRHVLLCVVLLSAVLTCTSAPNNKKKDRKKVHKTSKDLASNLCTMEGNENAMHCICVGGEPPLNATSAECWVFTGVTRDHSLWSLFATQPHLTQLKFLVRPQGEFTFVPTKGIRHLHHLSILQITYANIPEIHPYAFANSTSLKELDLARNQIVALDKHSFAHLTNLSELNLEENRIAELRRDVFVDLPRLEKFYAARNNLSVIQEGAFRHLAHLLELELDTNYISVLTRDTFTGLGELKRLDLGYNKVSMLGDLTFSELWVLEELNLENNLIELISDRAFAGLNHLRKLTLSHNRLVTLGRRLLGGIPTVAHLDLRDNDLETISAESVQPIMANLRNETSYFYIGGNRFVCDCRLAWLHSLRNETKNSVLRTSLDEVTCYMGAPPPTASPITVDHQSVAMADYEYEDTANYDDNNIYEQQQDSSATYVTAAGIKDPKRRHLFDIPVQELPCPKAEKVTDAPRIMVQTYGYAGMNASGGACVLVMSAVVLLASVGVGRIVVT